MNATAPILCKVITSRGRACRIPAVMDGRCTLHASMLLAVLGAYPVPGTPPTPDMVLSGRSGPLSHPSGQGAS